MIACEGYSLEELSFEQCCWNTKPSSPPVAADDDDLLSCDREMPPNKTCEELKRTEHELFALYLQPKMVSSKPATDGMTNTHC